MTLRAAFLASVALALFGFAMMLFGTGPMIEAGGLAPFDTRSFGYSLEDARAFLSALTPEARATYLGPQRIADTLFPIGLLGTLALGALLALRSVLPGRVWSRAAFLATLPAIAYFIFDMLENAAVAGLLSTPPEALSAATVTHASMLTLWKFRFVWAAIAIFLAALLASLIKRRRP